jgi:hypothetical protein
MVSRLQNSFPAREVRGAVPTAALRTPGLRNRNRRGPAPSVVRISNAARAKLTSRVRRISNRKAALEPGL